MLMAGASAMILPGVSGAYLLLVLGQYEIILGAIDQIKQGLTLGHAPPLTLRVKGRDVVIPAFANGVARAKFRDLCLIL